MKFQVFNFETDLRVERELVHSIINSSLFTNYTAKEQGQNEQHSLTLHKLHKRLLELKPNFSFC